MLIAGRQGRGRSVGSSSETSDFLSSSSSFSPCFQDSHGIRTWLWVVLRYSPTETICDNNNEASGRSMRTLFGISVKPCSHDAVNRLKAPPWQTQICLCSKELEVKLKDIEQFWKRPPLKNKWKLLLPMVLLFYMMIQILPGNRLPRFINVFGKLSYRSGLDRYIANALQHWQFGHIFLLSFLRIKVELLSSKPLKVIFKQYLMDILHPKPLNRNFTPSGPYL